MTEQRSEIVFFDLETTIPTRPGQAYALLEFGAILVCPRKLTVLESYSTLLCPSDISFISGTSERCNGITRAAVSSAPSFALVADKVFHLLNGRIWAGHNILRFDCPRIREAFAEINRPPPEPIGYIDSLVLLTERFGRRAGNMKMATLASYFGLGQQTHRSLDDVLMNLEVVKYCATVLFLESSLPDILTNDSWVSPPSTSMRTRTGGSVLPVAMNYAPSANPTAKNNENQTVANQILNSAEPSTAPTGPFNMRELSEEIMADAIQEDNAMEDVTPSVMVPENSSSSSEFLTPDDVSISSINAFIPFYRGSRRILLLHNATQLKLFCPRLKVRFGISTKFPDQAERPKLSFVVDAPPRLCHVLDVCDTQAHNLLIDSTGTTSEWRPMVSRKDGYWNFPTVRLHIPTVVTDDVASYGTEIFQREAASGAEQKLVFSKFEPAELERLFVPGTLVDAFFTLDQYDYQQNAGIRLVAAKLVIHSP